MLKILGAVLGLVVVAVLVICVLAAAQPSSFSVQRSTVIAAQPNRILPLIEDFHNFSKWSPWQHLDPNMSVTYSGAPAGPGAVYEWTGNSKAGSGRMEILSATPNEVVVKLDFLRPFESHNTTTYTLTPEDASTHVTWAMAGPAGFMTKVMTVFTSMDKMVGSDFENGLANLKAAAEASPQP